MAIHNLLDPIAQYLDNLFSSIAADEDILRECPCRVEERFWAAFRAAEENLGNELNAAWAAMEAASETFLRQDGQWAVSTTGRATIEAARKATIEHLWDRTQALAQGARDLTALTYESVRASCLHALPGAYLRAVKAIREGNWLAACDFAAEAGNLEYELRGEDLSSLAGREEFCSRLDAHGNLELAEVELEAGITLVVATAFEAELYPDSVEDHMTYTIHHGVVQASGRVWSPYPPERTVAELEARE
jgi:hypothetical protein